jgi:glycosyltransferase involved in cell wall biosynthesis
MSNNPHISVISPVYGASGLLHELVEEIKVAVAQITDRYEIILVEDCGPDDSWEKIKALCLADKRVVGIRHSRNFGQQYALNCGLDHAAGEWVVTLDCDLQDRPAEIANLYRKAQEGFDIVLVSRQNRQDDFIKKFCSRTFYRMLSYLTDTHQDSSVANFAIYRRTVVDALKSMNDYYRYYPTMIQWVGFKSTKLEIEHAERTDGIKSSYNFRKRQTLALDTIISFSDKPLRLTVKLGILISVLTAMSAVVLVVRYFMGTVEVSGWTSLFFSIWFLSGLIITILGMIGIYVGRIFESVKCRPSYIVGEILNYSDK